MHHHLIAAIFFGVIQRFISLTQNIIDHKLTTRQNTGHPKATRQRNLLTSIIEHHCFHQ